MRRKSFKGKDNADYKRRGKKNSNANVQFVQEPEKIHQKRIYPKNDAQKDYMKALEDYEMVFGIGPAGTGKTLLAVNQAVKMLLSGEVERIVLCRPAVEAGEKLGFLPGDLKSKIDPYLRPLYDSLNDMLPAHYIKKKIEDGTIEITPLAFMRGRTLTKSFVILDEAQNTTEMQMKMLLTRMGDGTRMAINGDIMQTDLPNYVKSGLMDAIKKLHNIKCIKFFSFSQKDIIRHHIVAKIIQAYDS